MAYPTKPTLDYSYTGFAQGQGDNSFPGSNVDNDLANLKESIDETIDFVSVAMRSDGGINAGAIPETAELVEMTEQAVEAAASASADAATAAADAATATAAASAASASASSAAATLASALVKSNNLSDLTSASTARTNLGVDPLVPPAGAVLPYAGSTEPTGWLFCYGQSLLRASYAALFTAIGTTFGAADGTHFNLPDLRGRAVAGRDDMGGSAAGSLNITMTGTRASTGNGQITALSSTANLSVGMKAFGTGIGAAAVISSIDSATQVTLSVNNSATGSGTNVRFGVVDGATLGAAGGAQTHVQTKAQMPLHGHALRVSAAVASTSAVSGGVMLASATVTTQPEFTGAPSGTLGEQLGGTGGGQAHPNVQPTFILNYIIKT